ncbi:MAG: transporter substrate-binding domain-containing protein [Eubacteriaceae bacterium]
MKKMLKALFIATFAVAILGLTGCGASKESATTQEKLMVGMELAYPPFETKDAQGNPSGVSVDFAKALGESLGKEVVIENIAWDGLIPSLETGKIDLIISSMTITEGRKEIVDFSIPYANSTLAILANKNSGITSVEDLNQPGKKVAVKIGSTGDIYAKENLKNAEIIALADESACVTEVVQGKADGFLYDQLTIYRNNEKNLDTTTAIFIPFQNAEHWGVAVSKENPELLAEVNTFIEKYKAENGFEKLTEKYLAQEKAAFDGLGFVWFFDVK